MNALRTVGLVACLLGCGSGDHFDAPDAAGVDASRDVVFLPDAPPFDDVRASDVLAPSCAPGTDKIYVASTDLDLYRFDPVTLTTTKIGPMRCGTTPATIITMGVDRSGIAWVVVDLQSGMAFLPTFWKIDISNASCVGTLSMPPPGYITGETFYGNANPASDELLLGGDGSEFGTTAGFAIGRVNTTTGNPTLVGTVVAGNSASRIDLTATGDGRLYATIFPNPWQAEGTNAIILSERNPTTAASLSTKSISITELFPEGVAFWGADFWFFLTPSLYPGPTPAVGHYKTSDSSYTTVVPNLGFEPAGAGVSLCAPVTPPN
jgi:hypothetical protein